MSTFTIQVQNEGGLIGNLIDQYTAGEDLTRGSLCYLHTDGKFYKADARDLTKCSTELRIAQEDIVADATGLFIEQGFYSTLGLTVGVRYYVSETPGEFTTTQYTNGSFVRYIGTASSATRLEFNPSLSNNALIDAQNIFLQSQSFLNGFNFGDNSASNGTIRLKNGDTIYSRNSSNSGNRYLLYLDSNNVAQFSENINSVFGGSITTSQIIGFDSSIPLSLYSMINGESIYLYTLSNSGLSQNQLNIDGGTLISTFLGGVVAETFSGNGSSLTNIDALTLEGESKSYFATLTALTTANSNISDNASDILALQSNQNTGVASYVNLADLPGTGTANISYKVTNDNIDNDNNGYYHWNGSSYIKDAELVEQLIEESNTSTGVSGKAVFDFIQNKVFVQSSGLTTLEENIQDAFESIEIWGSNVSSSEDYYLARIGYDRTSTNDIYFQLKRTDGTLIGFDQFDKTDYDEGLSIYYIQDYVTGYNFKITINWDSIPSGTDYTSGTLSNMKFDKEKVHIQSPKKEEQLSKNTAFATDDTLYIASKFSNTEDCVIEFSKCMHNNLMTFRNVKKVLNNDVNNITYWYRKQASVELSDATLADNIGSYKLTGGGWVGGNHGFEGTLSLLTSAYTSGDTTMDVTDGTLFVQTGGDARTDSASGNLIFQYTGVSGNQLTGVTGLSSNLTTSNEVQVYQKTAETTSFEFYIDNKVMPRNIHLDVDEVTVKVTNTIYDSSTLNLSNGIMDVFLTETVLYKISQNNIEVNVVQDIIKTKNVEVYYGMQLIGDTWQQIAYLSDSQDTSLQAKGIYPDSGGYVSYPNCDKIVTSKSDRSYNCALWFDPDCYYSQNRATYLDSSDPLFQFNSNGKLYHGTVLKDVEFTLGSRKWWRGVYTFFYGDNTDPYSYAYLQRFKSNDFLSLDFHSAGEGNIEIGAKEYSEIEEVKNVSLTAETEILSTGVEISASGYGTGLFKYKN